MTAKALIFACWLLTPGLLLAQTRQAPPPLAPSAQMYEDIEIMRRIINRKLAAWPSLVALNQRCVDCHTPSAALFKSMVGGKFCDVTETVGLGQGTPDIFITHDQATGEGWDIFLNDPHQARNPHVLMSIPWNTEGVYLKGHGVVYTVTLPPPPRIARPQGKKAPAKPVSDWDRIRRELRKDKEQPKDSAVNDTSPADDWIERNFGEGGQHWITETFLKMMAENGHHFSQLPENESLTVAITFRDTGQLKGVADSLQRNQKALESWGAQDQPLQNWGVNSDQGLQGSLIQQPALKLSGGGESIVGVLGAGAGDNAKAKPDPSSIRDLEVLGDLHLRQGKAREAIKTYQQALNQSPEPKLAAEIYFKIAQANVTLRDDAGARAALAMVEQSKKMAQEKGAAKTGGTSAKMSPAAPAVSKLIISAAKRLLDNVAAGKLGFHDFENQVTIESVGFTNAETKNNKLDPTKSKG